MEGEGVFDARATAQAVLAEVKIAHEVEHIVREQSLVGVHRDDAPLPAVDPRSYQPH